MCSREILKQKTLTILHRHWTRAVHTLLWLFVINLGHQVIVCCVFGTFFYLYICANKDAYGVYRNAQTLIPDDLREQSVCFVRPR